MTTRTGRDVRITKAGYVYVDGRRVSDRIATPFYHCEDVVDDPEIIDAIHAAVGRRWRMVNSI